MTFLIRLRLLHRFLSHPPSAPSLKGIHPRRRGIHPRRHIPETIRSVRAESQPRERTQEVCRGRAYCGGVRMVTSLFVVFVVPSFHSTDSSHPPNPSSHPHSAPSSSSTSRTGSFVTRIHHPSQTPGAVSFAFGSFVCGDPVPIFVVSSAFGSFSPSAPSFRIHP